MKSGAESEICEVEELLSSMMNGQEEQSPQRIECCTKVREREKHKLNTRRNMVHRATSVGAFVVSEDKEDEGKSES